ncbi:MAG TPA: four helix bundle protein [Gemmatimonadaceae bacterium]|jgi:four helix bundle protein|nr:four helix bundle protein [Gemmatimonadaceae bacterium]
MVRDHRDLVVWKTALKLVIEAYALATRFPPHERYGLSSQLQRAVVSVPANIAEGNGRLHRGEYVHHLSIARGSLMELATHIEVALCLNYLREDEVTPCRELIDHTGRMLSRMISSLTR